MWLLLYDFLFYIPPVVGLLRYMVVLFLDFFFYGLSILFSITTVSMYIPAKSTTGVPFFHTLYSFYLQIFLRMAILAGSR